MAPRSLRQALAGLAGAVAGTLGVHFLRDLPWNLSGLVGLAIGVLVLSALRTGARIRSAWQGDSEERD